MGDTSEILFRSGMPCCDLSNYFTQDQLDNMPVFEKMIKFNKMKNYFVCQSLNLPCELPEFMKTNSKEMEAAVQGSRNDSTKLSEEVKKMLLCTDIPLSYYTSSRTVGDKFVGGKLNLPLCKNGEYIKQIWDNLCWIAPTAIKEMEEDYKMRKRALELFKSHKLGANELQLFFPTSLELLENAIDNLSLQKDKKCNEPRYAFRKVAKKDYCEVESDESDNDSVDEAQLLESVKELGERVTSTSSRDANFEDNSCSSTSRESSTPLRWNLPNSFAAKTLPDGLSLRCSNFPNAVLGIFTSREFKRDTIFGPYVGVRVYNDITKISGRVWEIFVDGYLHHYIDGEDPQQSNWMRYINHANSPEIQNLESFQYRYKIYYRTTKDLPADTELMVWYSDDYNQDYDESQKKTNKVAYNPKTNADNTKKPMVGRSALKAFNSENSGCGINSGTDTSGEVVAARVIKDSATCSSKVNALERVSSTGRRHKCEVCGSTFTRSGSLKRHMRIHTGEKPYKCEVCGSTFTRSGTLKRHMKIHTGEKPYKCEVCGSTFTENGTLKRHMKIHTGEKPYKCEVCGSTFAENGGLKRHMRVHVNPVTSRA